MNTVKAVSAQHCSSDSRENKCITASPRHCWPLKTAAGAEVDYRSSSLESQVNQAASLTCPRCTGTSAGHNLQQQVAPAAEATQAMPSPRYTFHVGSRPRRAWQGTEWSSRAECYFCLGPSGCQSCLRDNKDWAVWAARPAQAPHVTPLRLAGIRRGGIAACADGPCFSGDRHFWDLTLQKDSATKTL